MLLILQKIVPNIPKEKCPQIIENSTICSLSIFCEVSLHGITICIQIGHFISIVYPLYSESSFYIFLFKKINLLTHVTIYQAPNLSYNISCKLALNNIGSIKTVYTIGSYNTFLLA